MFFYAFVERDGIIERLAVTRGTCIFRKSVDGEADGIELLLGVAGLAFIVKTPIGAAILLVDEMIDDIVFGASGQLPDTLACEARDRLQRRTTGCVR